MNIGNWQIFTSRHIETVHNITELLKVLPPDQASFRLCAASDILAVAVDAIAYLFDEARTEKENAAVRAMLAELRSEQDALATLSDEFTKALLAQ